MDAVEVELSGEIDVDASRTVREAVLGAVREAQGRLVVVDMAAVTFIDSSGLSALVAGLRLARNLGGAVEVVHATTPVRRVFEVTGLAEQFGLDGQDRQRPQT